MADETPVLDVLAAMTAASLDTTLEPREWMLARLAALASVNAPAASYVLNAGTASEVGVTLEDVQGLLVAIAPIIGTARVTAAASKITQALGFIIAVATAELEAELEAEADND